MSGAEDIFALALICSWVHIFPKGTCRERIGRTLISRTPFR
jgi:hypothetical protein